MIKVFTNDFRCDMMEKGNGATKGVTLPFFNILCKDVFIRRKTYPYNKVKIGVRKWNFDHALTFITER